MTRCLVIAIAALLTCGFTHEDQAAPLTVTTSWVGNTFGGKDEKWVQIAVDGICVGADGTVYTDTPWDENGREVGIYRDGDVVGLAGTTHGWGMMGGSAVAVNSRYLFFAQSIGNEGGGLKEQRTWPIKGKEWTGITRRQRANPKLAASWPAGLQSGPRAPMRNHYLLVAEQEVGKVSPVTSLDANDKVLVVRQGDRVLVYDAERMTQLHEWPIDPKIIKIALDQKGTIWAAGPEVSFVRHFKLDGSVLKPISLPETVRPSALCTTPDHRIGIADDGPDQNIKWYDAATGRLVATLGEKGGVFAGERGLAGPLRFHGIHGLGVDASGNVYVAHGGRIGTELESYTPSGNVRWRLLGLEFVDMPETDPVNANVMFTKDRRFGLDLEKRQPGTEWSYQAYTLDPFKYPDDPRLRVSLDTAWVRRIQGRRFLFLTNMYSSYLAVYRFDPAREGDIAIPCAFFAKEPISAAAGTDAAAWPTKAPNDREWIWIDRNGDGRMDADEIESRPDYLDRYLWGWSVGPNGTVTQALNEKGIRTFPFLGLGPDGIPQWSFSKSRTEPMPQPFTNLQRAEYDAISDTMLLSGYTREHPNDHGYWKIVGREIALYENWSKGNRKPSWRITPPWEQLKDPKLSAASFCTAGKWLFTVDVFSAVVTVYDRMTGDRLGEIHPGPEVGGISGWVDIPYGIQAIVRKDGEVIIFVEEDARAKTIMYRWRPSG